MENGSLVIRLFAYPGGEYAEFLLLPEMYDVPKGTKVA